MKNLKMLNFKNIDNAARPSWLDKILDRLRWNFLDKIVHNYEVYKERISRSWAFAKMGWLNYDFDAMFLYNLMAFKLRRVQYTLKTYSVAEQSKNDMDALQESVDICDRLFADDYADKHMRSYDKKWGKPSFKHGKKKVSDGGMTSQVVSSYRKNVKTKKDQQQASEELMEAYSRAEEDRVNDIQRLAQILAVHLPSWWD